MPPRVAAFVLALAAALSLGACTNAERAAEPPNETGGPGAPAEGGETGGGTDAANTGASGGGGTGDGGDGAGTAVDPQTGR